MPPAPVFRLDPSDAPVPAEERAARLVSPGFGRVFTDHMATVRWTEDRGWHEPVIGARRPFQFDPAAAVLHYAQEIFEGLKAYRLDDGGAALFRPDANAARLRSSARRLAMPELPDELFLRSVEELVAVERDWIPDDPEGALYLRPFQFASESFLGVKPASEYVYAVIASSVGAYFKGGLPAVSLWVSQEHSRSGPGGTGAAKCGGNYAASLLAQKEAVSRGFDQVVFLDAVERRWVEELGGMNLFFVFADESVSTPPLNGSILPGVTRDSLLHIARDLGIDAREEPYAVDQWRADAESGRLSEVFACGTAAVVTPVARVADPGATWTMGSGEPGPVTLRLREALVAIQRGRVPDPRGWMRRLRLD